MSTITVTSSAGLLSALQSAQSGDTILLAAGSYSNVVIQNFSCAGTVTITSADPNNKAVLSDLNVMGSSGLAFTNLELSTDASKFPGLSATTAADPYPFRVANSDRVSFDRIDFHGSLDNNPGNDRNGLSVDASKNVSVTNSEFHELSHGIVHSLSQYVNFSGNNFHDIRSDGIIGTSSNVMIANNYFTNFYPNAIDHADTVQFFDVAGVAPHDLVITGNVYVRGSGAAVEGFFLTPHVIDDLSVKFVNVQITDNLMIGTNYHGITVLGAQNLTVSGNALYGFADYTSRIWIGNSNTVVETNNKASAFIYGSNDSASWTPTNSNTNITVSDLVVTTTVTDGGKSLFDAWLSTHSNFTAHTLGSTTTTTPLPPPPSTTLEAPTDLALGDSTDSGAKGDGWTKTAVLRVDGAAQAGASVLIYEAGVLLATSVADANGVFSALSSLALHEGAHFLTAVARSASGVLSTTSTPLQVVVDHTAASLDLTDFGLAKYSKNSGAVTLTGTVSDNSNCPVSVQVMRDGVLINSASISSGAWSFTDVGVSNAVHTYTMQGVDIAGNVAGSAHSLVIGGSSNDTIRGTTGDDIICAGAGNDTVTGGGGNDTFVFRTASEAAVSAVSKAPGKPLSIETITDFNAGDKLDLTDLGHLTFGNQTSTATAQTVNWYNSGGNTYVFADVNGDGQSDFVVKLVGLHTMTANDFLLS